MHSEGCLLLNPIDAMNAALHLEGTVLDGGWTVGPRNVADPNATGGFFSVTYPVQKPDGQQGFLKVLDLGKAMSGGNFVDTLQFLTAEYAAERDLCVMCGERRLSRVVVAMDHGEFSLPGYALGAVSYIIFELATHDIRVALGQGTQIDAVLRLEYVHNLAVGLRQLHQNFVAHQDLKPSNFLLFPDDGSRRVGKIADLGRAFRRGTTSPHDGHVVPGDRSYAPPEQLYRHVYPDENTRRYAADLYQLGSLMTFLFTGTTMNALIAAELPVALHWSSYGDPYSTALPYLEDAFSRVLHGLEAEFPTAVANDMVRIVAYLCSPDAIKRGHPAARRSRSSSPFALQRVVTDIDLLVRRLSIAPAPMSGSGSGSVSA